MLPLPGKTIDTFDFAAVPMLSRAHVNAVTAGDSGIGKADWKGGQHCVVRTPWRGQKPLDLGYRIGAGQERLPRVLFTRRTDPVQKLQQAQRDLALESAIAKLDKFDPLVLDDIACVTKDQAGTSVLFELISARYKRRSTLVTANQTFGAWDTIFPDPKEKPLSATKHSANIKPWRPRIIILIVALISSRLSCYSLA
jgi:hypothetical protein